MLSICTVDGEGFRFEDDNSVACEQQTYFRSSLLSLRKIEGGGGGGGGEEREGTTGKSSLVRRLTTQWLYLIYFIGSFLVLRIGCYLMTLYKILKIH